jgi:hypothetical protein
MAKKPKTKVHTYNGRPTSVLSGRVSHCISGYRRVPWLRKSSTVKKWQNDRRADYYKIILDCVQKLIKNKSEKEVGKGSNFKMYHHHIWPLYH